jgi:predicted CoA-substrate-specific enzyme activase
MLTAGIDVGSVNTKVVILDPADGRIVGRGVRPTGHRPRATAAAALEACLVEAGIGRAALGRVVATGYARHSVELADDTVTEIRAAALGARHWHPGCRTLIDIGGQDSKVLGLDDDCRVSDFVMNDRCAAGTGHFLSVLAVRLNVPLEQFGPLGLSSRRPVAISSLCVVMAESEILSLVAADTPVEDIIAGLHDALARRVANMAARIPVRPEVVFTGGVAADAGMARALGAAFDVEVRVCREPLHAAALGAALS